MSKACLTSLADAVKTALEVEYGFGFGGQQLQIQVIRHGSEEEPKKDQMNKTFEKINDRFGVKVGRLIHRPFYATSTTAMEGAL